MAKTPGLVNAQPIIAALQMLLEAEQSFRAQAKIARIGASVVFKDTEVGERIAALQAYVDDFGDRMTNEESDIIYETMLRLFLLRDRKYKRAFRALEKTLRTLDRIRLPVWASQ